MGNFKQRGRCLVLDSLSATTVVTCTRLPSYGQENPPFLRRTTVPSLCLSLSLSGQKGKLNRTAVRQQSRNCQNILSCARRHENRQWRHRECVCERERAMQVTMGFQVPNHTRYECLAQIKPILNWGIGLI